jgi:arylsulfatase A-like enzyme
MIAQRCMARIAGLVLLTLFVAACGAPPRARNLIVITLDTMRADRLPAYGFSGVETPALDRLAAEGAVFEQAFAAVPLTLPSHASLFTGLYPPRLSLRDNVDTPLAPEFTTMAEVLKDRGLATAAFVASGVLGPMRGLDQGFGVYNDASSSGCVKSVSRRPANEVVDQTIEWLSKQESPFFAWVHLYDTHRPYRLPPEHEGKHDDPYLDAIAFEDAEISRLVDYLERTKRMADTLIVVAGDHGESLGDHGEEGHGIFIYQEGLHVPLIMRGPGILPRRVNAVTRLVDVMPTVLELFGAAASSLDGVSLLGFFARGDIDPQLEVYAESLYPQRFGWAPLRSLRADRYKVIEAPRPELYDLDTDPAEQRNIFEEKRATGAAMLDRLHAVAGSDVRTLEGQPHLDAGAAARIASLGYVGGTAAAQAQTPGLELDPKDQIETFNRMTRRQWEAGLQFQRTRSGCSSVVRP